MLPADLQRAHKDTGDFLAESARVFGQSRAFFAFLRTFPGAAAHKTSMLTWCYLNSARLWCQHACVFFAYFLIIFLPVFARFAGSHTGVPVTLPVIVPVILFTFFMKSPARFIARLHLTSLCHWVVFCAVMLLLPPVHAQVCAAPGALGALTVTGANTLLNTYYPGTSAGGTAGVATVGYTSASARGAAAPIAAGDLVLVIQMQDGTGGTTANNSTYAFPAAAAGNYEFARVLSLGANVLNLSANLINKYTQNTAVTNNQTYQVIRVPQYATLSINAGASVVPMPWDGTTGGVVVTDVAGAFVNNGSINASYAGFRGNAGLTLGGAAGAIASTATVFDRVQPDTFAAHGGKGEGTAGTPDRILNVFASPGVLLTSGTTSANGTATNLTTAADGISAAPAYFTAVTGRSYNGGSRAAGAPAIAGGGGDDGAPAGNGENSGGGGGGNTGAGGVGGNTWNSNLAIGGRGGIAALPLLASRLTLGGGGGSGTTNNGYGLDTSGGAGGGLIFIKAGTVSGTGALLADGQAGRSIPTKNAGADCPANAPNNCDGGGGGGAGGGIVLLASSGVGVNASVRGGQGGNVNGTIHGPGGGGGGGYTFSSSPLGVSSVVLGGVAGLTNVGGSPVAAYGAGPGAGGSGFAVDNTTLPAAPGGLPANCLPALTTTKITSTPAATSPISPPGTTTYSIVVANAAGKGDARGINLYDPALPGGVAVAVPPTPTVTFSLAPSTCLLATRTAVVNPANGATSTFTMGTFNLPGGCTATYSFAATIAASMPNGTYSNSALAFFTDPTDTSGSRTVTTALPPAAAGLVANTAFTTGGAVAGSNYDGNLAANTADDIRVQRSANLQITKSNGTTTLVAGSTTSYTVTLTNLGPNDVAGAVLKDPAVPGLACTSVTCASTTGAALCPSPANVTLANLQSPPGSGIVLNNAFPANSSITFAVQCSVTATGQ